MLRLFKYSINLDIVTTDNINNSIPIITDKNELILCFTTSALFSYSNLGYFKLIISPIKCDISGVIIENISNNIISKIFNLNLINRIMSPINIGTVVIDSAAYILDIKMVLVLIGNDFSMLIFFPSKLITELVIDVINAADEIRIKIKIDI